MSTVRQRPARVDTGSRTRLQLQAFRNPPPPTPSDGPDPYGDPDPEWLGIEWRRHLKQVDVMDTAVSYCEMGEGGPPIVFVHGLGGCWENWLENIPHFARSHRVIALDLPGFGDSPTPPWEVTISNYGKLVDELCRRLNLHESILVGNSMGGFISAEVAIAEPDWVERLVLVSAAGISSVSVRREPAEAVGRLLAAIGPLSTRMRETTLRRWRLRRALYSNVFHDPAEIRPELLWEFSNGAAGAPAFMPALTALLGYDHVHRLERVGVPTLIVWGRNDRVIPAADALEFERHLSDSRLVILGRCGHVPMAERPVRFNRLLDEFTAEDD